MIAGGGVSLCRPYRTMCPASFNSSIFLQHCFLLGKTQEHRTHNKYLFLIKELLFGLGSLCLPLAGQCAPRALARGGRKRRPTGLRESGKVQTHAQTRPIKTPEDRVATQLRPEFNLGPRTPDGPRRGVLSCA